MKTPLISIIMNCHNSDFFLKEAIDSIYAQTYSNWEIIFWDNASTDESKKVANSYDGKLKYYYSADLTSLGEARNFALEKATGVYIAFLDCDDLYLPFKLERQVRVMVETECAMSYGSAIIINDKGSVIRKKTVKNSSGFMFGALLRHYEINMQSVMIKHSILLENSLRFSSNLRYCPDHNLFMNVASLYTVGVIKSFIVKYRVVKGSLSTRTIDIVASEIKFTLDQISKKRPELKKEFILDFQEAYQKLYYYDAVAAIYRNDKLQAKQKMKTILMVKIEYFIFFIILFLPISSKNILRIIGR